MEQIPQTTRHINRRFALGAIATAPLLATTANAAHNSTILALYGQWKVLTAEQQVIVDQWENDEITSGECEDRVFPIFRRRDVVEEQIWSTESVALSDMAIKIEIAKYYDFTVDPANAALVSEANHVLARGLI